AAGAHRHAEVEHGAVDGFRTRALEQDARGLVDVWRQAAVDEEARRVLDDNRKLAESQRQATGCCHDTVAGVLAANDFDQWHLFWRIEEMDADDALRVRDLLLHRGHRKRTRIGCQNRMVWQAIRNRVA